MAESVYKVIELVGTSTESWEKAATRHANHRWQGRSLPGEGQGIVQI